MVAKLNIAALLSLCLLFQAAGWLTGCEDRPRQPPAVRIGSAVWKVELAMKDSTRQRGMGGRTQAPEGTGMLFVFPDEQERTFHMLDCHIPLDIVFVSSDLRVVEIRTMAVESDPAHPQYLYPSRAPAQYALELAEGGLARAGVKPGDRVELLGSAATAAKEAR
jgi:uncharacterized protein